jgi:CSLREA domain-containing protein
MLRSPIKRFSMLKRRRLSIFIFAVAGLLALWWSGIASAVVHEFRPKMNRGSWESLLPPQVTHVGGDGNDVVLRAVAQSTATTITNGTELATNSTFSAPFTVKWSVTPSDSGTPTGNVTVTVAASTESCTAAVATGQCDITPTSAGTKQLTATYEGDTNFTGSSSSPPVPHTVDQASTTTTISNTTELASPTTEGNPFRVAWSVTSSAGTPTGTVSVTVDGNPGCSAAVTAGQCFVTPSSPGVKAIVAHYGGDTNFLNSDSGSVNHTVNAAACATPPTGMVAWYPGENNANDIIGSSNGTPSGGVTFAPGKVAQAFNFDGVDGSVNFGNTLGNFGTSDFSIDFWIKTTSTRFEAVLNKRSDCSDGNFFSIRLVGGTLSAEILGNGTGNISLNSDRIINDGAYHHIALVRSNTTASLYIDGVVDTSQTAADAMVADVSNTTDFQAGVDQCTGLGVNYFTGQLDEIEVFDHALTTLNIADIYNASFAGKCHTSTIQFSSATYSVDETGGTATITVTRAGAHDTTTSVQYDTIAGGTATGGATCAGSTDYQTTTDTLNFGINDLSKTFTVPICDDGTFEGDETVKLQLSNVMGSGVTAGSPTDATLTIQDDESAPDVTINDVTQAEGDSGSSTFTFTVSLSNPSATDVLVNYATANGTTNPATAGSDYTVTSGSVTITAGSTSAPIDVTVSGDTVYELDETFFVNLTGATGGTITDNQGLGTITNDDAAPTLAINDRSINEGTASGTSTSFTFTVTKTGGTDVNATVNFATGDGTASGNIAPCPTGDDYQTQMGSLTFLPNETTKTITVPVCKDSTYEANETFLVNLSAPDNATIADDQGVGTILNDDAPGAGFTVNTTLDTDDEICAALGTGNGCSLREAINAANSAVTAVAINFAIPATDLRHFYYKDDGAGSPNGTVTLANVAVTTAANDASLPADKDPDWPHGWWSILPMSALPTISKSVVIDGYTQTDAASNTASAGDNAILRIELNGASAGGNVIGLNLTSTSSIVRGLVINRFQRDSDAGTPTGNGINLQGGTSNSVTGDFIGTDVSGTLDLGNGGGGVFCTGNSITIGGSSVEAINLISGNDGDGLAFSNSNSSVVQNNLIGTKADGASALGNGGSGVSFSGSGSVFNTTGGAAAVEGNTIAFNGAEGVRLFDAGVGNSIRGNSIFSNGSTANDLGIDLGADGITANDAQDEDSGPNNLQNFPDIAWAVVTGSTRTIAGSLNSTPGETFTIDFYQNSSCDTPGGNGEGQTYLGSVTTAATDSNGDVQFMFHPAMLTIGQVVTATATSTAAQFNTSEFSRCATVYDGSPLAGDIQFVSATYNVAENDPSGVAVITFKRVNGTYGSISATFSTSDGTAQAPGDYSAVNQTVTFNEGETSKTVNVPIVNDSIAEADETVNLSLTHPPIINAAQSDSPGEQDTGIYSAVLTITNDDCPTSFTVDDNGDDGDGNLGDGVCATSGDVCTLRAAIEEANASLASCGAVNININTGSVMISLTGGPLTINHDVNINGPASREVVDGNALSRLLIVNSGKTATISSLTLSGGNGSEGDGGAIQNSGTLTLNRVTLSGNTGASGGAIRNDGALVLTNTTISGNNASGNGGGLYNVAGTATLTNVTISNNRSDNNNDTSGDGGGIFIQGGSVLLHNTIVGGNFKGGSPGASRHDISGILDSSSSFDLIGDGTGMSGISEGSNGNHVGTLEAPIDPLLGALTDNGGPTFTHGLLYNSLAIDKGDNAVTNSPPFLTTDQRGLSRQADGDLTTGAIVDIGAYERQPTETRNVPDGSNVLVDLVDATISFPSVGEGLLPGKGPQVANGGSTVSITVIDPSTQPAPPPGYAVGNSANPPLPAFDVSTTASYTGPVNICFYLPAVDHDFFAGLKLLHNEGGVLVDRTSGINFGSKTLCGQVSSFSVFVIAHTAAPTADPASVSGQILDSNGLPVEGAAVRMTGTQNRLTVTDANGHYHFDNVETNGFYNVTPSRANFMFSPTERSFSQLGNHTDAVFTGTYNGGTVNPLDTTEYFVRQQYVDFLNREPDEAGFNFWVHNIEVCGSNQTCRAVKRTDTSAAFFLSVEFQQTGYLVYKIYQSAYGDMPNAPVPLTRSEFKPDTEAIGQGVVVNQTGWETVLENNKQAFTAEFVTRSRFTTAYPTTMTPAEFVDKLFLNAGVVPSDNDRTLAINEFDSAADSSNVTARAKALRRVAENLTLNQQEFNQAFVLMEYFGYLRRSPNEAPEANLNYDGYNFWLSKLERFNGDYRQAQMVQAFLVAGEYRQRFPK